MNDERIRTLYAYSGSLVCMDGHVCTFCVVTVMSNPYTHLRTLLDDESRHIQLKDDLSLIYGIANYTTSLDALIPLWPEGWNWEMFDYYKKPTCNAVNQLGLDSLDSMVFASDIGKTPALAMLDCLLQVLEYDWEGKR